MATSPEYLNKAFQREVDEFELKLDSQLEKKTVVKGGLVSIDIPSGMSQRHFALLETRYISAGWASVKWNSDQREGMWLTFTY